MKKVKRIKNCFILFAYFFLVFDLYGYSSVILSKFQDFSMRFDMIYPSVNDKFYVTQKNVLYEIRKKDLTEIFSCKKHIQNFAFDKKYLVFTFSNEITVINIKDKKILWQKTINGNITVKPIISNGMLFVDKNSNAIVAFNITNGDVIWKFNLEIVNFSFFTNAKLLHTEKYLVYVYSNKKIVVLLKESGLHINTYYFDKEDVCNIDDNLFIRDVVIYNQVIYVLYNNGLFFLIEMLSGKEILKKMATNYKSFKVYKDKIIVLDFENNLTVFNKFDGNKLWTKNVTNDQTHVEFFIIFRKGAIFFYDKNGNMCFIDVVTGKEIYSLKCNSLIDDIKINSNENLLWIVTQNGRNILLKMR